MTPRLATPDDVPALRALHLANWREAYVDLLLGGALGTPAEAYMERKWTTAALAHREVWFFPAVAGPLGFIALERDAAGCVFVDNLHIAAAARGQGLAQRLMRIAAETAGAAGVWLYVLNSNHRARAVYAAWGGTEGAPFDTPFLGMTVQDRRIDWPSGHVLLHALEAGP